MNQSAALQRRLGPLDAVAIGLGSMLGAGIFSALSPAAAAAGWGMLAGLAVAGVVAFCNATSSAQLAAQYPTSGGTYVYGRERLGEWFGFAAGWAFVIGKTASAAAMALVFAAYVAPPGWGKLVACAAVAALTLVNVLGITRTALATKVLLALTLAALAVVVVIGWNRPAAPAQASDVVPSLPGVLQAAAFLFFAFAGYARLATMGEEVREPARTIPRAITLALFLALGVYALVAVTALRALGPSGLAGSAAPLAAVASMSDAAWSGIVVTLGAAAAALGALLALIAGIGRTSLAMAREDDLPRWLAAVHPRFGTPRRAELLLGAVVCAVILVSDVRGAIGFSSAGVLLYYLVANAAAWTQTPEHRRYPRALQALGAVGCLALAFALPPASWLGAIGVLAVGLVYRWARLRLSGGPGTRASRTAP